MRRSDFDYHLPLERIAQVPLAERDASRMLVFRRETQTVEHRHFINFPEYLEPDDVLVVNDTRVNALRLIGSRVGHTGETVEAFLTTRIAPGLWQGLVRPGKKLLPGAKVDFGDGLFAEVLSMTAERGGRTLQFETTTSISVETAIEKCGIVPLPPYITTPLEQDSRERYQTVYSTHEGSAAAPTAGLHFTQAVLDRIAALGVRIARVTLHVGLGTFRPIETDDIDQHVMHGEQMTLNDEAADVINTAKGRVIAVGTTSARALESAAVGKRRVEPSERSTSLFVKPGYEFKVVDALVTNFHMPKSTLLLLVSALTGTDQMRRIYADALAAEYRFLSFGDSMLII